MKWIVTIIWNWKTHTHSEYNITNNPSLFLERMDTEWYGIFRLKFKYECEGTCPHQDPRKTDCNVMRAGEQVWDLGQPKEWKQASKLMHLYSL